MPYYASMNENDDDFDSQKLFRWFHEKGRVFVSKRATSWAWSVSQFKGCNATKMAIRAEIMRLRYERGESLWGDMPRNLELKPQKRRHSRPKPPKNKGLHHERALRQHAEHVSRKREFYRNNPTETPWFKGKVRLILAAILFL